MGVEMVNEGNNSNKTFCKKKRNNISGTYMEALMELAGKIESNNVKPLDNLTATTTLANNMNVERRI